MALNFFSTRQNSVTSAALVIGAAGLLSRGIGLVRDRVFAHYFGAGPTLDAYYAAFKLPDLIHNLLVVGALTAGFIPVFTALYGDEKKRAAGWELASNILNILSVALLALVAIGMAAARPLTHLIAPGFSGETLELTVRFTRLMLLSPLLLGLSLICGGILQSLRRFTLYSLAPLFYNLGIIAGATLGAKLFGPLGLPLGVLMGSLWHLLLQFYGARMAGWRWSPILTLKNSATRAVFALMLPRTIGLAANQLSMVVMTIFASLLPTGSVTIFNLALNLSGVSVGLIGISFAVAAFPLLAELSAKRNEAEFSRRLSETIRQILFLIIPASILLLLLRAQIVRVILGSGKFDWTATIITANTLAFLALGLFAQALVPLLARAFYALHNTFIPVAIAIISEVIGLGTAYIFMRPLGVAGLALGQSVLAIVNTIALALALRWRLGTLGEEKILHSLVRIGLAGLFMALIVQLLKYPIARLLDLTRFYGILLHGLISGTVGLLAYFFICRLLKLPEYQQFEASLRRRLRARLLPPGIDEIAQ